MRTLSEIISALIPGSDANRTLRIRRERPTNHPGSKQRHNERKAKARRVMAAASNKINRRRCRRWKY
jgi:hypothetical protein